MNPIEEYIAQFDEQQQKIMRNIYQIIKSNIPKETIEKISWGMATFHLNGNLVHFAMNKKHLGFYPGESGVQYYVAKEEHPYKFSKGAIQFPLDQELPEELIKEIVCFRVKENQTK